MNVYIWGTGLNGKKVLETIDRDRNLVVGFIDNNPDKQGKEFENIPIISSRKILKEHDHIIIAIVDYAAVLYQLKLEKYDKLDKVIVFYDEACFEKAYAEDILNKDRWRIALLEHKVRKLERLLECRINNLGYEIIDAYQSGKYVFPHMARTEEAVDKIIHERCSLIRFGDGEFEIMAGKERPVFQSYKQQLGERLKEVIAAEDEGLLIAIANNYGSLEQYPERGADGIREYMTEDGVRDFHMSMLNRERKYYDAYMFKSYMSHRDKSLTEIRINLIKRIWNKRDIVIIEGDKTRTGYGNELFDNVNSIKRVLGPTQNAFDVYDKMLEEALKIDKNDLILMALGPAGKVLAYDLVKAGYQVVDIGQIDMDYEWYKAGLGEKVPIPDKYVSQLPPAEIQDIDDVNYLRQIVSRVCVD